jgi:hypothetical protein
VGRWIGGTVKDTATVIYDTHTCSFDCTCKNHREQTRREATKRGYCDHINRLTLHNLRQLPTLPAPAREVAAAMKEKPNGPTLLHLRLHLPPLQPRGTAHSGC